MLPFLRAGLALATFSAALVLCFYLLVLVWVERNRRWPDLDGPTFDLTPGATGSWDIEWPEKGPLISVSELHLVVDPIVDPGAVDVTVIADATEGMTTCHARESLGVSSDWTYRGVGTLPAQAGMPLLFWPFRGRPVQHVSWIITRVGSSAAGARAHLAVRGESRRSRELGDIALSAHVVLPAAILLFAWIAVRCGLRIHRRTTSATGFAAQRARRSALEIAGKIALFALGTVGQLTAFTLALATVGFAMGFVGSVISRLPGSGISSRGGDRGPSFELTRGASGSWERGPDPHPASAGNELLWLCTDLQRRIPRVREIEVYVRVEPPEAAWSFDPGPRPESGEWRLGPREDDGRALVVDRRRVDRVTWRVESLTEEWQGSTAWLETCGSCARRRPTDGEVP